MQVSNRLNIKIDQAVPGDLVKHVVQKRHTGRKFALTGTIKIQTHSDLRLQGVACNFGLPHGILKRRLQKLARREP